jgi:4-diphosphocytidyl-2-C-methyl-D-erythritol kinase
LVLANPGEGLSTRAVFDAWDGLTPALTAAEPGSTLRSLSDWMALDPGDSRSRRLRLREVIENDLEEAARRLCPSIDRIQRAMHELGAEAVGLSGSGATSFGVFASAPEANQAIKQMALRGDGWARLAGTLPDR